MKLVIFALIIVTSFSAANATESNMTLSENITLNHSLNVTVTQSQAKSQQLQPKTIGDMSQNDLKNLLNEKTDQIITTLWQTTSITEFDAISHTLLGFILGFFGTMVIEIAREARGRNAIRRLLRADILRIHRNVHQNLNLCTQLSQNSNDQHVFLNNIRIVPDLENLQQLGASQQFNFWQTIISSTQLVLLQQEQIRNAQFVYDASRTYNNTIESLINGIPSTSSPYMVVGGKQLLANNIFVGRRNMNQAHQVLTELCMGLIPLHQSFLQVTRSALISLRVRESEIP